MFSHRISKRLVTSISNVRRMSGGHHDAEAAKKESFTWLKISIGKILGFLFDFYTY